MSRLARSSRSRGSFRTKHQFAAQVLSRFGHFPAIMMESGPGNRVGAGIRRIELQRFGGRRGSPSSARPASSSQRPWQVVARRGLPAPARSPGGIFSPDSASRPISSSKRAQVNQRCRCRRGFCRSLREVVPAGPSPSPPWTSRPRRCAGEHRGVVHRRSRVFCQQKIALSCSCRAKRLQPML